jgi:uncharacterized protein with HEPN domain
MTQHNDAIALRHIREHTTEALQLASGKTRADLDSNRMLNLSLTRLLEIIGEAAARVTAETRKKYPQIPWTAVVGMRNRLIHGYDQLDFDVLWDVVQNDLPPLLAELNAGPPDAAE